MPTVIDNDGWTQTPDGPGWWWRWDSHYNLFTCAEWQAKPLGVDGSDFWFKRCADPGKPRILEDGWYWTKFYTDDIWHPRFVSKEGVRTPLGGIDQPEGFLFGPRIPDPPGGA